MKQMPVDSDGSKWENILKPGFAIHDVCVLLMKSTASPVQKAERVQKWVLPIDWNLAFVSTVSWSVISSSKQDIENCFEKFDSCLLRAIEICYSFIGSW